MCQKIKVPKHFPEIGFITSGKGKDSYQSSGEVARSFPEVPYAAWGKMGSLTAPSFSFFTGDIYLWKEMLEVMRN